MVKPNFIPRTLRGVGGVRLFNIPGVIYPKEVLVTKEGFDRKSGRPYKLVPGWGLTSREAATMLGSTPPAARAWLHRRKVPFRIVSEAGKVMRLYWRKDRVEALAGSRNPVLRQRPDSYITTLEARRILCVGRSSLHRYQKNGKLTVTKVRIPSNKGLRLCSYFDRSEVEKLASMLNRVRLKEEELRRLRDSSSPSPADSPSKPARTKNKKPGSTSDKRKKP